MPATLREQGELGAGEDIKHGQDGSDFVRLEHYAFAVGSAVVYLGQLLAKGLLGFKVDEL